MSLLLDSHALEWAFNGDARLSGRAAAAIAAETARSLFVSDVTLLELARHVFTGKIPVVGAGNEWLQRAATQVTVLPVTSAMAWRAVSLKWNSNKAPHRDPADRLIVATALERGLTLVSKDRKMHELARQLQFVVLW